MLQSSKDLMTYKVKVKNGRVVGRVRDILFDDLSWCARYLVVDTGSWLVGQKTLVGISQCFEPDAQSETLEVSLTEAQIEKGPMLDEHAPVSRQYEMDFARHFQLMPYWAPAGLITPVAATVTEDSSTDAPRQEDDPDLRSMSEVMGYSISANDGEIGQLEELIIDDVGWIIRYLVVDTRKWLPAPKVLIAPEWAKEFVYKTRSVTTDLNKSSIQSAPRYDRDSLLLRDYEGQLCRHYGREGYWETGARAERIDETTRASISNPLR